MAALSAVATNNSGFMFIGLIGTTFVEGISAMWLMIGWVAGDYLMWAVRVPDRLRERSRRAARSSFLGSPDPGAPGDALRRLRHPRVPRSLCCRPAHRRRQGAQALFGWDLRVGAVIGAVIVVAYCFAGGIRASI